jgi:YesN/AraC family two-component response regulator
MSAPVRTDAGGQITTFYEKAEEYGEIKKTVDKLIDEGKRDEATRLANKYAKEITLSEIAESFKTDMNEFTQLEKMTRASNMTPEIKRVKLDQIREAKIIFARSFNAASRQL